MQLLSRLAYITATPSTRVKCMGPVVGLEILLAVGDINWPWLDGVFGSSEGKFLK